MTTKLNYIIITTIILMFISSSYAAGSGWSDGANHWIIPTDKEWNCTLNHCGGPLFHQKLYDLDTGEQISDGGKPDIINRTHLYHTLIYTCEIDACWHDQAITIPFYAGGNIIIHSAILGGHTNSWADVTTNHWTNYQLGRETKGIGEYTLPPEAYNNLP